VLRLLRWFDSGWEGDGASDELRRPIGEIAARILDRRRRVVRRRSRDFARQSPEQRHRLRIALKKLRYAADVLACLYDDHRVKLLARRLKRLQDDLGNANDLHVGHDLVSELVRPDGEAGVIAQAGKRMLAWHAHRIAKQEPKLRRHLERLLETDPFWSR
jgi:CHAD domain-containing protein